MRSGRVSRLTMVNHTMLNAPGRTLFHTRIRLRGRLPPCLPPLPPDSPYFKNSGGSGKSHLRIDMLAEHRYDIVMLARATEISVVLQGARLRTFFYCPQCETSNEVMPVADFGNLCCRECKAEITASGASLKILGTDPDELTE